MPESQEDPIQRPFQRSAAADFQHRPIFFAQTVILHRNSFNSKKLGKIEGMAFRTIKILVRFLIFCPSPRPPSWAPTDWRWLGLRYNLTEILCFDEIRTRSRWKRVLVADRVRNSAHWSLFCTKSATNSIVHEALRSDSCTRPLVRRRPHVRAWRMGSNIRHLENCSQVVAAWSWLPYP